MACGPLTGEFDAGDASGDALSGAPEWQLAAQEEEDEEEGGRTGEGDALLRVAAAEGVAAGKGPRRNLGGNSAHTQILQRARQNANYLRQLSED